MKIFLKIIYALTSALGLFLVYSFSERFYRSEEINKLGQEAIVSDDMTFFVASKYFNDEPLRNLTINESGFEFQLYIYEVVSYKKVNNEVITIDGISIIMHQKQGNELNAQLEVKVKSNENVQKEYTLLKYGSLPIYTVVNHENNVPVVERTDFESNQVYIPIEEIQITLNDQTTLTIDLEPLLDEEFTIKGQLMEHYEAEGKALEVDYQDITVIEPLVINSNPLIWLWIVIYSVLVVAGTFTLRKWLRFKDMGKKELTPGLETDLIKLNQKDES
jgi:hypothetical protein